MSSAIPLSLKGVCVGYGDKVVAKNLNFDLSEGEVFGFIGLNGQGKTTLIKSALGLRQALSGDISIFGNPAGSVDAKKNVAYLPEKFMPSWFMSGMEFVRFTGDLYGQKISDQDVYELAEALSLDKAYLSERVQKYSKGMGQKLGLISTILTGGALLVLDEPMSGLDPLARAGVKNVLSLCKSRGQTVFLSSHILSDLDELCDRIAILDSCELKYIGSPEDLKAQFDQNSLEKAFLCNIGQMKAAL